jgi:hypothetical protein
VQRATTIEETGDRRRCCVFIFSVFQFLLIKSTKLVYLNPFQQRLQYLWCTQSTLTVTVMGWCSNNDVHRIQATYEYCKRVERWWQLEHTDEVKTIFWLVRLLRANMQASDCISSDDGHTRSIQ